MRKLTTKEFIEKAIKIHGNKYDYSKVKYKKTHEKVCIICPIHGEFYQTPHKHLRGMGCRYCGGTTKLTTQEFINKARKVHGDKYDYSKVEYVGGHSKVRIVCPTHGEFEQESSAHLSGQGCPYCSHQSYRYENEEFINRAREIHGDKYDYSKVKYVNNKTKVCIICPRHGEFWQSPIKHINAKNNCPKCNMSKLEELTSLKLKETNVSYKYQATSKDLEWLGKLTLDFYLPEYKVAIECQGIQHFKPIKFGGKNDTNSIIRFMEQIKRDKIKKKLCEENNVKLMCIENINELNINEIKKMT